MLRSRSDAIACTNAALLHPLPRTAEEMQKKIGDEVAAKVDAKAETNVEAKVGRKPQSRLQSRLEPDGQESRKTHSVKRLRDTQSPDSMIGKKISVSLTQTAAKR